MEGSLKEYDDMAYDQCNDGLLTHLKFVHFIVFIFSLFGAFPRG